MAVQDLIESLKSFDPNDLSDLNSIGSWPVAVKAIIWVVAFIGALVLGYFVFVTPLQDELSKTQGKETSLRGDFEKSILSQLIWRAIASNRKRWKCPLRQFYGSYQAIRKYLA